MSITRTIILVALILWIASAVVLTLERRRDDASISVPLPESAIPSLQTNRLVHPNSWGDPGQPYLINIWASWCVSCRAENTHLKRLKEAGVRIVGINFMDERDTARAWLTRYGSPFELVLSDQDGSYATAVGVQTAPETLIVDSQGVIRFHYQGQVDDQVWQRRLAPIYASLKSDAP